MEENSGGSLGHIMSLPARIKSRKGIVDTTIPGSSAIALLPPNDRRALLLNGRNALPSILINNSLISRRSDVKVLSSKNCRTLRSILSSNLLISIPSILFCNSFISLENCRTLSDNSSEPFLRLERRAGLLMSPPFQFRRLILEVSVLLRFSSAINSFISSVGIRTVEPGLHSGSLVPCTGS